MRYSKDPSNAVVDVMHWNSDTQALGSKLSAKCGYTGPLSPDGEIAAFEYCSGIVQGIALVHTGKPALQTDAAGVTGLPIAWIDPLHLIYAPVGRSGYPEKTPEILDIRTHAKTALQPGGAFVATTYGL